MTSLPQPAHTSTLPFRAADYSNDNKPHILLASTGSVATIKLPLIAEALSHHNVTIRILLTPSASEFLQSQSAEQPPYKTLLALPNVEGIYTDADEWSVPWTRGASILHIELRRWADLYVIAPLSANSLAKMVHGMADSLVLAVARAWDTTGTIDAVRKGGIRSRDGKKVVIVAPAMNTAMWLHPVTARQIRVLEEEWGVDVGGWVKVLRPVEKDLACGDTGSGAMREWKEIVREVEGWIEANEKVDDCWDTASDSA
ncbi:hypothetical protein MBLNU457_g0451t1 [Dothideomycetes sp. NU457]